MELNLTRPIIIFDVESTGLNITKDRIIELSYIKVFPDGHEESHTYRINPEMPIPEQAIAVHHITDDDVRNCPTFAQLAPELAALFAGCDIAGFNSNHFDIPILAQEMANAKINFDIKNCRFIDVQTIYHKKEKRDLAAACLFYCGVEMENHHAAAADTRTTLNVLKAQLDRYPDLENDVEFLSRYSSYSRNVDLAGRVILNDDGKPTVNFGKYKGQVLEEVLEKDLGYASWVMNSDFPEDTKQVFREAKQRVDEKRKMNAKIENLKDRFNAK